MVVQSFSTEWRRLGYGGLILAVALALCDRTSAQMDFRRGDVDGDGVTIVVVDAQYLINSLFVPGSPSPACVGAADVNSDGANNIADVVQLLSWGFVPGSPPPGLPGPFDCGPDPLFGPTSCASYTACAGGALPLDTSYTLRVLGAVGAVGDSVDVTVELDNTGAAIAGWSFGLCQDSALAAVTSIEFGPAATLVTPFFEEHAIDVNGWTVGVLISLLSATTLPPGIGLELHTAQYDLLAPGIMTLSFCETLGSAPVPIALATTAGGVLPVTVSGSLEALPAAAPPANDDCANAISVTNGQRLFRLTLATTDGPDLVGHCGLGAGSDGRIHNDVWFSFRAGCTGPSTISALGLDASLAVYPGVSCPPDASTVIACNDEILGGPPGPSQVTFNAIADTYYLIQVGTPLESSPTGIGTLQIVGPCPTCLVPFPGLNPVQLPPALCPYASGNDLHMMINGLPPGTTIQVAAVHGNFDSVTTAAATGPFGPGIQEEVFNSSIELVMTGTGTLDGFQRTIEIDFALCETHTTMIDPEEPVQTIQADMRRIQGQLVGDSDFESLTIVAGTELGLPSLGATTLTAQPNGDVVVDSSFNINYRIEFVGAPGGALAGLSGMTTGIVSMQTGNGVALPALDGFLRGDANNDMNFNIGDAIALLNHLFSMAAAPACRDAADANDDGGLDIGDAIFVLSRLFSGGPIPPLPGSAVCGPDPTADALDCGSSAACP
ncbi:MAG: dockerin type I domain-containing protein [Planctomycetota bacterium]